MRSCKADLQFDLFVPYITDLPLRDQREVMERPFFALAKRKRIKPIDYQSPDASVWVKVQPHQDFGMATIYDADLLIWAASVLTEQMQRTGRNEPLSQTIHFQPYDLLRSIRRGTGGRDYQELRGALDRLKHTGIKTNIRAVGRRKEATFSWLDAWTDDVDEKTGESRGMTLTLSKWLFDGVVQEGGVLSLHPDYFLISGALERWLYRVARKHSGHQKNGWSCTVGTLYEKSGSESPLRRFRFELKKLVEEDRLPEYHLEWVEKTEGGDQAVHMIRRNLLDTSHPAFRFPSRKDKRRPLTEKAAGMAVGKVEIEVG